MSASIWICPSIIRPSVHLPFRMSIYSIVPICLSVVRITRSAFFSDSIQYYWLLTAAGCSLFLNFPPAAYRLSPSLIPISNASQASTVPYCTSHRISYHHWYLSYNSTRTCPPYRNTISYHLWLVAPCLTALLHLPLVPVPYDTTGCRQVILITCAFVLTLQYLHQY